MQQVTIDIPDNKMAFFLELIQSLGFKADKATQNAVLTPEQIELVNIERRKIKTDPNNFLKWEDARKTLKHK